MTRQEELELAVKALSDALARLLDSAPGSVCYVNASGVLIVMPDGSTLKARFDTGHRLRTP